MHLVAGTAAGIVILVMSVTGVVLTFEKQMIEWADRRASTASSPVGAGHLSPETLLAAAAEARPETRPQTHAHTVGNRPARRPRTAIR